MILNHIPILDELSQISCTRPLTQGLSLTCMYVFVLGLLIGSHLFGCPSLGLVSPIARIQVDSSMQEGLRFLDKALA